jgi:glutathionyl-hydroquinone reductase
LIGKIEQTGKYVAVTGGPAGNYVNNTGLMSVGQLQFNTHSQQLEMYNGKEWQSVNLGTYHVGLNPRAEDILDWAAKKMFEERDLKERMEKYPGLKDAYEQFQIMDILTTKEEQND